MQMSKLFVWVSDYAWSTGARHKWNRNDDKDLKLAYEYKYGNQVRTVIIFIHLMSLRYKFQMKSYLTL